MEPLPATIRAEARRLREEGLSFGEIATSLRARDPGAVHVAIPVLFMAFSGWPGRAI